MRAAGQFFSSDFLGLSAIRKGCFFVRLFSAFLHPGSILFLCDFSQLSATFPDNRTAPAFSCLLGNVPDLVNVLLPWLWSARLHPGCIYRIADFSRFPPAADLSYLVVSLWEWTTVRPCVLPPDMIRLRKGKPESHGLPEYQSINLLQGQPSLFAVMAAIFVPWRSCNKDQQGRQWKFLSVSDRNM